MTEPGLCQLPRQLHTSRYANYPRPTAKTRKTQLCSWQILQGRIYWPCKLALRASNLKLLPTPAAHLRDVGGGSGRVAVGGAERRHHAVVQRVKAGKAAAGHAAGQLQVVAVQVQQVRGGQGARKEGVLVQRQRAGGGLGQRLRHGRGGLGPVGHGGRREGCGRLRGGLGLGRRGRGGGAAQLGHHRHVAAVGGYGRAMRRAGALARGAGQRGQRAALMARQQRVGGVHAGVAAGAQVGVVVDAVDRRCLRLAQRAGDDLAGHSAARTWRNSSRWGEHGGQKAWQACMRKGVLVRHVRRLSRTLGSAQREQMALAPALGCEGWNCAELANFGPETRGTRSDPSCRRK